MNGFIMKIKNVFLILPMLLLLAFPAQSFELLGSEKVVIEKVAGVDIPVTWEEVQSKHNPEKGIVVTSETITKKESLGGSCHAGPVCALLIVVYAYQELFPDQHIQVQIHEQGRLVYDAKFNMEKEFLRATTYKNSITKTFLKSRLYALGKIYVFQTSEKKLSDEKYTSFFLSEQVELIPQYKDKLQQTDVVGKRTDLYLEVMAWTGEDAKDLVLEALQSAKEWQVTKRAIVKSICDYPKAYPLSWVYHLDPEANHAAAVETLLCLVENREPKEKWLPYVQPAVHHVCREKPLQETSDYKNSTSQSLIMEIFKSPGSENDNGISGLAKLYEQPVLENDVALALESCSKSPVQTLGLFLYGKSVSIEDFADVLVSHDLSLVQYALAHLKIEDGKTIDFIMTALEKTQSQKKLKNHELFLKKLLKIKSDNRIQDKELETLAHVYVGSLPESSSDKFLYFYDVQDLMFEIFKKQQSHQHKSKAASYLKLAYEKVSPDQKPVVAMALVVLGEVSWTGKAADGLQHYKRYYEEKTGIQKSIHNLGDTISRTISDILGQDHDETKKKIAKQRGPLAKQHFYKSSRPTLVHDIVKNGFHAAGCDEFAIEDILKQHLENEKTNKEWENQNFCIEKN